MRSYFCRLFEMSFFDPAPHQYPLFFLRCIFNSGRNRDAHARRIGQGQIGDYLRIDNPHAVGEDKIDILPYSDVAVSNARHPVPSFRADEGRTVETHNASIGSGSGSKGLFVGNTGIGRRKDPHREYILSRSVDLPGHVECTSSECAVDAAEPRIVEPDFSPVIDSVEKQLSLLSPLFLGYMKGGSVPPVRTA